MNELELFNEEKTMTVKEVSKVLGVTPEAIKKHVRELYPEIIKNGVAIKLNERQVTEIKQKMLPTTEVVGATTDYEMELMTQKVIAYHIQKANEYKARAEAAESVVNRIADSSGLKSIKEVADILGYGEKTYFATLRGLGILFKDNGVNLPKREYINQGYFEVKEEPYERNGNNFLYSRVFVTAKGLLWLEKKTPKIAEGV